MKASLFWWLKGAGKGQMQSQDFEEYDSDAFDKKLTELEQDDSVIIIEIMKGERPNWAVPTNLNKKTHLTTS